MVGAEGNVIDASNVDYVVDMVEPIREAWERQASGHQHVVTSKRIITDPRQKFGYCRRSSRDRLARWRSGLAVLLKRSAVVVRDVFRPTGDTDEPALPSQRVDHLIGQV